MALEVRTGGTSSSPASQCLGPLSLRLQLWLSRAARGGGVKQSKKPFCGTRFLRIALAGLREVSPMACMSWVLFSEVSLRLVSSGDDC